MTAPEVAPVDICLTEELSAGLAAASLVLARRFAAGATLWCLAPSWEPHAQHVAVEFVHPVIVGKKALPAVALTGPDLVSTVRVSVRPGDVVLAVASATDPSVRSVMAQAPEWGVTTLWIGSGLRPTAAAADHVLWLDEPDPRLPATGGFVLLYHLLWELTHVCFEHPGLWAPEVRAGRPMAEPTDFLYPFLDTQERDQGSLLVNLGASARAKAAESTALRRRTLEETAGNLARTAAEMARRFAAGGRLFAFGNGGSSTDATTLAGLFARPPCGGPLPAWSLTADQAILTALGNDVGFELVFARQLIARGDQRDIAVAMSTSGSSKDLTTAFREARNRGMYTIGFAGYDGGEFATSPDVDACFVVASQSVHRIQEAQALLGYQLWAQVHEHGNVVNAFPLPG